MRILVVEDDDLIADALTRGLSLAGFAVDVTGSAELAQTALATEHFDLAIVDIGLPAADGLTLLRRWRNEGQTLPVLILTARDTLAAEALDLGADDFLAKPFEQAELAARCRALLRRVNLAANNEIKLGRMRIDLSGHQLHIDAASIELTRREWLVLECLALNAGRLVSKDRLLQTIASWQEELTPNAVEVHISRLRAKLGEAAVIRTVRGLGYRLDEAKDPEGAKG
jgi:DNA-binding response OmpR family regulator